MRTTHQSPPPALPSLHARRLVLSDGAGPCYYRRVGPGALTEALEAISDMLDVQD